jgi:hypothetical protein
VPLADFIAERTDLGEAEADHLARLVAERQLLADLSFADLLLMCREGGSADLVVVAQMRPSTAQPVYQEDQVGRSLSREEGRFTSAAATGCFSGRTARSGRSTTR